MFKFILFLLTTSLLIAQSNEAKIEGLNNQNTANIKTFEEIQNNSTDFIIKTKGDFAGNENSYKGSHGKTNDIFIENSQTQLNNLINSLSKMNNTNFDNLIKDANKAKQDLTKMQSTLNKVLPVWFKSTKGLSKGNVNQNDLLNNLNKQIEKEKVKKDIEIKELESKKQ